MAKPAQGDGFENDPADVLELIARVLVGSSYRMPVEGVGSGKGMQASDVGHALGFMHDRVALQTITAVVTGGDDRSLANLSQLAYREVARSVRALRPPPLHLGRPADRMRMRIVVFDAAHDLVWPEQRRPFKELAREAKMRKDTYIQVYRCATSVLTGAMADGRREFGWRLFGSGVSAVETEEPR